MCDSCLTAMNYPDLTRRQYSTGCIYCAARYIRDGGKELSDWGRHGINERDAYAMRAEGVFVDPELRRRK